MESDRAKHAENGIWLTVQQVQRYEGSDLWPLSRTEVNRRMRLQPSDPKYLISKLEVKGKRQRRVISAASMTFNARERWRREALANAAKPEAEALTGQLVLVPPTDFEKKLAALTVPPSERDFIFRRLQIVEQCSNQNWRAEGYRRKGEKIKAVALANGLTVRHLQRIVKTFSEADDLRALGRDRPGPPPGTGSILDADMRAHLHDCWIFKKLTKRQCYDSLVSYLTAKQNSPGCRVAHLYRIPSYPTVARFLASLPPLDQAMREGPDALKEAAGHIHRTYEDLSSLDRVETDEWKCDFFAYVDARPKKVHRFWLLTFYDARSMYPLVWDLVLGSEYAVRHGIREEDEINLLVRLVREYGLPQAIHSDRGRFRGKEFGGRPLGEIIDERFARANGILDRLGIRHNMPREHNPRGSRLERFHRFLADCSRTLPGWTGANTKQREMAPGDAQYAEHKEWTEGKRQVTPLLSHKQVLAHIDGWMEKWRDHESKGTDMRGLSPRAVFVHNTPLDGFRRISDDDLILQTGKDFEVTIRPGGIRLPDGKWYYEPQLALFQGQRRQVTRPRHDHGLIVVHPAAKGEPTIIATLQNHVGANDPDELARQCELLARVRKIAGVGALHYDPGSQLSTPQLEAPEIPEQRPEPSLYDYRAPGTVEEEIPEEKPAPRLIEFEPISSVSYEDEIPPRKESPPAHREISSLEYLMEHERYKKRRPVDFGDLES